MLLESVAHVMLYRKEKKKKKDVTLGKIWLGRQ